MQVLLRQDKNNVRPSAWNNSALTGRVFVKSDEFFENLSRQYKFH